MHILAPKPHQSNIVYLHLVSESKSKKPVEKIH